jgi:hypothetical protein
MINSIIGGNHVVITNGHSSGPYVNNYSNAAMVGMVRYNDRQLEVYDGTSWLAIVTTPVTIDLSGSANAAITWALAKMSEEAQLEILSAEHPAIKAAYENMKRAAEQLKTTIILSKNEQTTN